jgi:putative aldouronate transport system permease protein
MSNALREYPGIIKKKRPGYLATKINRNLDLYLFLIPALALIIIFHYIPIYGAQIAFKKYYVAKGILGSPWVGFKHFQRFISSYYFGIAFRNTVVLSFYRLAAGLPLPIILAVLLNQIGKNWFKKSVQMVTYFPHFISLVIVVGILNIFLAPDIGVINIILRRLGLSEVFFFSKPNLFKHIYVISGVWQRTGYSAIFYIAALSAIDMEQYEAAIVDGATRLQTIFHIDLPSILPLIAVLTILGLGNIMSIGFEKAWLMLNPLNYEGGEILATYVYRSGLEQNQIELGAAVGLFNSAINLMLLFTANKIIRLLTGHSLF